jgi:heavy metal sensor kinase
VDEDLAGVASAVVEALDAERRAGAFEGEAVATVVREFRLGDAAVGVLDRESGAVVVAYELAPDSPDRHGHAIPAAPAEFRAVLRAAPLVPAIVTTGSDLAAFRVVTVPYRFHGRELVVGAARSLAAQRRTLDEARRALLVGAPLMLLFAAAGGYALARKSLQPVATMTDQAARIGEGTLHERLPVQNPRDELGRLGTVFNGLLGRVEAAFDRQRRFMADASHELRTPVAIIGGEAELALTRDDRSPAELRAALATIDEESARLARIVEELFLLARADAGAQPLAREELYLADLVADAAHRVRTLAARKDVTIACDARGDLPFRGDPGLLRRLVLNLLDNAIKYTPAGGRVHVVAERRGDDYVVEVADSGPGIPPEAQPRIFDRFFRANRDGGADGAAGAGGAGLGLAIARWIAEAHGGRLELTRSGPRGSTFTALLPVSAPDP